MLAAARCGCISICTGSGHARERLYFTGLEMFTRWMMNGHIRLMATKEVMMKTRKMAGNC